MKIKLVRITILLLLSISTADPIQAADLKPKLRMVVISDAHVNYKNYQSVNNKLERALVDLKTVSPNYEVIAFVGDMTEHGLEEEYDLFNAIFKVNKSKRAQDFFVIGNHEWFENTVFPNSKVSDEELKQRFLRKMGVSNLYYDKWINGYHFISLAGEKSMKTMMEISSNPDDGDSAFISEAQYKWLQQRLPIKAELNKPIFVFLHQPIRNTVYGSHWGAGLEDQKLLSILKHYPQIILFSGHSHYVLNHPKSIVQNEIIMVNTGSVAYTFEAEKSNYLHSQGLIVTIYGNKIELQAREFSNSSLLKTTTLLFPWN
ncbi:metallophosphoesterase family protein [Neobacillus ginsengisoli]|uniref:Phosphodiesterase n=1 Tax=Neobacillus ginsengisoli TaxID=904295 RepID=A0ABT9XTE2_9BACI|nr:metallophosphoesterase [Neobacillus ginsengisoli]MDQ0198829.1 putative phosphodiesterase [Neobacillus ginsengisoli]